MPLPFAEYQLRRFCKRYPDEPAARLLDLFLADIRTTRETVFHVMDDFVRNRFLPVSPDNRLSTEWLTRTLADHDPRATMPSATFKSWQKRGLIRMEAHGKPLPANAAAVLMMRLLDRQKEHIFPESLPQEEPNFWCCVVESPASPPEVIAENCINRLPHDAIVWTPWVGAAWQDRWHILGENEGHLAAIRFAGTRRVRGQLWWNIGLQDLKRWDTLSASLYLPIAGHHERQVEDLATIALGRIFAEKVPAWNRQEKRLSKRMK